MLLVGRLSQDTRSDAFFFLLKGRKGREIICRHEGEREVKLLISLSSNSVYLIIIVQVFFFFRSLAFE